MAVTPSRIEIIEGESAVLSASASPEAAFDRAVAWSSSDRSVATVDKAGTVHGLRPGTATVTATAEGKSGTCAVTVKAKTVSVTEVTLDKTELTLTEGETGTLTATVKPDNADNRKVMWSSDKTDVATVGGDGRVTAVKAGEAVVTVTTEDGGKTASCKVTVKSKAVNVTEVTLDKTELTLTEGETETLTATVKPDNADNKKVTWSSDKTDVATVDGAGRVTAMKAGEAVITVTTEDGGKTASCKVTVKAKVVPVTGVDVKPWSVTIGANGTTKLTCTVAPSNATNRNVRWESDNPSVATVDSDGNVRAVSAGVAKVSAVTEDGGFKSYCTVTVKKAESKFEVGGLWYEYYYAPNLARVIPDPDGSKYGGNISIPGQIEYGGITYSVVQIWSHAFYECADLKSVTLGEGIGYIDAYAFYNCPNLERITFSSTMNSFNNRNPVFERCPKLEIVTTPKTSESQRYYFYTHGGVLYRHCYYSADTGETEVLSWLPEKTTGVFAIKDGVEVIDEYSLSFTGIDNIIIPESVKYIGTRFFNDSKTPLEIELNWRTKEDIDRISTIESDPSRFFFVRTDRSAVKVTVPKGTKSLYESHWLWSHLGGIEERP